MLVTREIQITITMRYHLYTLYDKEKKGPHNIKFWQRYKTAGVHILLVEYKIVQPFWKTIGQFIIKVIYLHSTLPTTL